jgi:type III pantothenate kinase
VAEFSTGRKTPHLAFIRFGLMPVPAYPPFRRSFAPGLSPHRWRPAALELVRPLMNYRRFWYHPSARAGQLTHLRITTAIGNLSMILVLDIGNTHVHIGLFTRGKLRASWNLSTDGRRTVDEYSLQLSGILGDDITIEGSIISSVVPRVTTTLHRAIERTCHVEPMILSARTNIGIRNGYLHPEEVGMDRLANAVGGHHLYGFPLLILGFGTAITLEYLAPPADGDPRPVYRGGIIMPGIQLAADALARGTSKLPLIDVSQPAQLIGRTTVESIRSGLVNGYLGAVETLIARAREEIGLECTVISTGGDAMRFAEQLPFVHDVEPDLSLYGLRQIYGINNNCPLPDSDRRLAS